jgi:lipid-binding SYLF domain-containing protein
MRAMLRLAVAALGLGSVMAVCPSPASQALAQASEQQQLVDKCRLTIEALRGDPNLGRPVNDYLARAHGVLIFPNLMKAGFFVGAGGGQGVLLTHRGTGWSDPVFVYAADASFGLQIGVEGAQIVFAIMNDGAVRKLLNGNANLGGDVSVAVGPWGAGAQGATTPNVGADLVAFSLQQGAFAGVAVKGGVVSPRDSFNEAYYGRGATPERIVAGTADRPGAQALKVALSSLRPRQTGSAR